MIIQSTKEATREELIQRINELQLENNQLKRKIFDLYNSSGEYEKAKSIMTKELQDYIPKQVIRDELKDIELAIAFCENENRFKELIIKKECLKELLGE